MALQRLDSYCYISDLKFNLEIFEDVDLIKEQSLKSYTAIWKYWITEWTFTGIFSWSLKTIPLLNYSFQFLPSPPYAISLCSHSSIIWGVQGLYQAKIFELWVDLILFFGIEIAAVCLGGSCPSTFVPWGMKDSDCPWCQQNPLATSLWESIPQASGLFLERWSINSAATVCSLLQILSVKMHNLRWKKKKNPQHVYITK